MCPTPRTKGSKNKPKTVTADFATQIAEKQSAKEALTAEIASITANIDTLKAKVEHVFGVVKKQLRFRKTRYRGLEKQQAKFNIMFALANLILADRACLAA